MYLVGIFCFCFPSIFSFKFCCSILTSVSYRVHILIPFVASDSAHYTSVSCGYSRGYGDKTVTRHSRSSIGPGSRPVTQAGNSEFFSED